MLPDDTPSHPDPPPVALVPSVAADPWSRARLAADGIALALGTSVRAVFTGAAAVFVAIVAAAVLALSGGPTANDDVEVDLPMAGSAPAPAEAIVVHVHAAGAVAAPGLYRLPDGSRVADLIEAAGGPGEGAELDRLNLAAPLRDGDRVWVPRAGQPDPGPGAATSAGGSSDGPGLVNINTASITELETLPGVGPATAQAIVDWRDQHGPFRSVDQLLEVRGIGEAKLAALRERVTV